MTKKPNIIFILNDHQAYYGHGMNGGVKPLRPNFDNFAAEGMNFTNGYCVSPLCGPSRRTLLTGLYPHTHGQVHNENDPPYDHEVYLDTLYQNGYKNYYFGKWHAGPGCAYDHHCEGFSATGYGNPYATLEYAEYLKRYNLPKAQHYIEYNFLHWDFIRKNYFPKLKVGEMYECENSFFCGEHAVGITTTPKETHEAFFLAALACEQLEALAKSEDGKPFNLRVDFWGPHQPHFPTQEFVDMYNPEDIDMYPNFDTKLENKPKTLHMEVNCPIGDGENIIHPNPVSWKQWQQILARCYAHVSMVDAAGGRIINKLKELGLYENTIIVWSTDHGDAIACQGGHFDKHSHMAQEVMRIPIAINWKDVIAQGQTSDKLVQTCDIPVTLLDAAGLKFSNRVDGASLLNLACHRQGEDSWRNRLMFETYGIGYGITIIGRMIVKDSIKYVCTEDDLDELYDLEKDPYELNNLAVLPEFAELKDRMRALLKEEQKKALDPIPLEQLIPKGEVKK